jgi:hypothetical protein
MKRIILALIFAATALLVGSSVAPAGVAHAYPPGQAPVIRINVSSVRSSDPFTVTISPCIPGETVIFRFRDQTVTTTCDPVTASASATFTPRINPGNGPQGFASPSRVTQSLVSQAPPVADVPAPGIYPVFGDLTGNGVNVPPGFTRPLTLSTSVEVLAGATEPTTPPVVTTPGGGLPATGSSGLGTTATSAIVLISAGLLLLIVTQVRRRRTAAA